MTRTTSTGLAALALLALGACSAGQDSTSTAPAAPTTQASAASGDAVRNDKAESGPRGDCDLLSAAEIEQAFGNKLRVTRVSGRGARGSGCTVSIAEGTETQLVFQVGGQADYDARKETYLSQSRVTHEPVPVGTEAYLVNGGQVIAVDAEGRSISVGLMLLVFDGNAPVPAAEVASGVQSLARLALERL
jgi:hypothetical protein